MSSLNTAQAHPVKWSLRLLVPLAPKSFPPVTMLVAWDPQESVCVKEKNKRLLENTVKWQLLFLPPIYIKAKLTGLVEDSYGQPRWAWPGLCLEPLAMCPVPPENRAHKAGR